jgi:SPP1 family predicted phage head-tail adaptor
MTYGGVRSGDLRRRITIQSRDSQQDTFGQQSTSWVDVLSCWAQISPANGREQLAGDAQQAETTHRITIRYRPGITAAMRVVYEGRLLEVTSVLDDEMQHRKLQLMCSEGLAPG